MHIQRICLNPNHYSWLVINDDGLPVLPIQEFIRYLEYTEKSPNTIRAYAHHLKLFWEFLTTEQSDWKTISITELARFVHWLRSNDSDVICLTGDSKRTEVTVNTIVTCLSSFYRYHKQSGNANIELTESTAYSGRNRYRSFLYHIHKHKPVHKKIIALKTTKTLPKTLSPAQIEMVLGACPNVRDGFLLRLLYETGIRIGQALGLQHQDIHSWDNLIHIIPRENHVNGARTKSRKPYVIHVSPQLMQLYTDYINDMLIEAPSHQYVFINLNTKEPISYPTVRQLFSRLSKKLGFKVTAHMFRHTHATELIRQGWDASLVQKRLGHASVQTTLDIYSHLDIQDLKKAFQDYLLKKEL